jgi:hypothetical protein
MREYSLRGVSNSVGFATAAFESFLRELHWHRPPGQVVVKDVITHSFRHSRYKQKPAYTRRKQ